MQGCGLSITKITVKPIHKLPNKIPPSRITLTMVLQTTYSSRTVKQRTTSHLLQCECPLPKWCGTEEDEGPPRANKNLFVKCHAYQKYAMSHSKRNLFFELHTKLYSMREIQAFMLMYKFNLRNNQI